MEAGQRAPYIDALIPQTGRVQTPHPTLNTVGLQHLLQSQGHCPDPILGRGQLPPITVKSALWNWALQVFPPQSLGA